MNITIKRDIEVPDGLLCCGRKDCPALNKDGYDTNNAAYCGNFSQYVFYPSHARYFVKCRQCIDATLSYLHGVTR